MVKKVRMTYSVELFVKTDNDDQLGDWLNGTTPAEAKRLAEENGKMVTEDYSEEIICNVRDDSDFDIDISK